MRSEYSLRTRLRRSSLNLESLQGLEKLLRARIPQAFPHEFDQSDFKVTIKEREGSEELETLDDYPRSQLPDRAISVSFDYLFRIWEQDESPAGKISASIEVGASETDNRLRIAIEGEDSRARVLGLRRDLDEFLHERRSLARLFKPPWPVQFLVGAFGVVLFLVWAVAC